MPRHKDNNWKLRKGTPQPDGSNGFESATIQCALLMDLRDELQKLNALLGCPNFTGLPHELWKLRQAAERLDRRAAGRRPLRKKS